MALPRDLKELNKRKIKSILRQHGAMTKAEIAEVTDISVVTVNKLIRALEEGDEIIEQDNSVVTGGRRAISYKINPNFQQVLVVSLQEKWKKITYSFSVYNLLGEVEFVEDMSGEDLDIHALKEILKTLSVLSRRFLVLSSVFPELKLADDCERWIFRYF